MNDKKNELLLKYLGGANESGIGSNGNAGRDGSGVVREGIGL